MKRILLTVLMMSSVFARFTHEPTGWEYNQSTFQAFYLLEVVTIDGDLSDDGDPVVVGDGDELSGIPI